MKELRLLNGDCLDKLKELDNNSIDSIVTDPPYGLSFMGKKWDYDVPSVEIWQECLRVLKPGGHLLAFAGSRTYHRMAVRIEDAGFDIRDQIMWIYGSGFPKSHNVGKSIDKMGGKTIGWFGKWLRQWRQENKIAQKEIAKLFPSKTGGLTGCVANWELGLSMPTTEQFNTIIENFDLPFENIEQLEREIIGTKSSGCFGNETDRHTIGASKSVEVDITKGNSIGEGWGTALKPAHEPIVMARKPIEGTVAENTLQYGVGGLNIDATRVGSEIITNQPAGDNAVYNTSWKGVKTEPTISEGRWPANIILECTCENPKVVSDKYDIRTYNDYKNTFKSYEENDKDKGEYEIKDVETTKVIHTDPSCPCYILDKQSGNKKSIKRSSKHNKPTEHTNTYTPVASDYRDDNTYGDEGGASRFFYCPKTSAREREEGLVGLQTKANAHMATQNGTSGEASKGMERFKTQPKQNFHPTVKPTELMKYLIRLVTPKDGIVLDPFMGSGSTGKAAMQEGMWFVGIEREKEYFEIAKQRIEYEADKRKFW